MNRQALILTLATILASACNEGADSVEYDIPVPAVQGPHLDLNMTGGRVEADHMEVAPGVFMLRDLALSGEVTFQELPEAMRESYLDSIDFNETPPPPLPEGGTGTEDGDGDGSTGGRTYCYEYDSDYYSETTRNSTLFGGNPSWYGSATGYSYHSNFGGHDYRSDYVSAYVYSYAPSSIDSVYSYGYVYINGRYVGYMSNSLSPGSYATAYGSWSERCPEDGSLDIDVRTYHYMYDGGSSLTAGYSLSASIACCP